MVTSPIKSMHAPNDVPTQLARLLSLIYDWQYHMPWISVKHNFYIYLSWFLVLSSLWIDHERSAITEVNSRENWKIDLFLTFFVHKHIL